MAICCGNVEYVELLLSFGCDQLRENLDLEQLQRDTYIATLHLRKHIADFSSAKDLVRGSSDVSVVRSLSIYEF